MNQEIKEKLLTVKAVVYQEMQKAFGTKNIGFHDEKIPFKKLKVNNKRVLRLEDGLIINIKKYKGFHFLFHFDYNEEEVEERVKINLYIYHDFDLDVNNKDECVSVVYKGHHFDFDAYFPNNSKEDPENDLIKAPRKLFSDCSHLAKGFYALPGILDLLCSRPKKLYYYNKRLSVTNNSKITSSFAAFWFFLRAKFSYNRKNKRRERTLKSIQKAFEKKILEEHLPGQLIVRDAFDELGRNKKFVYVLNKDEEKKYGVEIKATWTLINEEKIKSKSKRNDIYLQNIPLKIASAIEG